MRDTRPQPYLPSRIYPVQHEHPLCGIDPYSSNRIRSAQSLCAGWPHLGASDWLGREQCALVSLRFERLRR